MTPIRRGPKKVEIEFGHSQKMENFETEAI